VLKQVSRRISHFLNDHKVYKSFLYEGKDHLETIQHHFSTLSKFMQEKNKKIDFEVHQSPEPKLMPEV